jgi:leader peptidase (prepilin peptidase)/N-methyltransferase
MTLWSLFWAFLLVTGKEGLGYGDFKLLAALGAWLGWQAILPVLLLASLAGAVIGLILIVFGGRERSAPLPFGPFLAAAGFVMLIWGPQALALYGTLFAPH